MPLTPLFAALALGQATDFDGLTLGIVAESGPTTSGPSKVWTVNNVLEMDGAKVLTGTTTIAVTNVSALPQRPSSLDIMTLHYNAMYRMPNFFGTNLSKYKAKMGGQPVALTFGSAMVPAGGGGYMAGYLASMAFMVNDKVYEVVHARTSGPYAELVFNQFKDAKVKNGEVQLSMTEMPDPWSEAFQIGGLPFVLDWPTVPNPIVGAKMEGYKSGYSAWGVFEAWTINYEVRQLTSMEGFDPKAYIEKTLATNTLAKSVTVSDLVRVEGQERWTAKVQMEFANGSAHNGRAVVVRSGEWVAGQYLRGLTTVPAELDEKFKLTLAK